MLLAFLRTCLKTTTKTSGQDMQVMNDFSYYILFVIRTFFITTLALSLTKIYEHTMNITQAKSRLRTFLF